MCVCIVCVYVLASVLCMCVYICVGVHMHAYNDSELNITTYLYILNRLELLVKGDNSDPNLQMLLKLVDLLASCSEGENLFIESVCQNIMSINELLKVTD